MFQITWREYIIFILSVLVIYYLYVVMKYFRKELLSLIGRSDKPELGQQTNDIDTEPKKRIWQYRDEPVDDPATNAVLANSPNEHFTFSDRTPPRFLPQQQELPDQKGDLFEGGSETALEIQELQNAVIAIRHLFSVSKEPPIVGEILKNIQVELQYYPRLMVQPYKLAINNLIAAEAKEHFNLTISELELNAIWPSETK